MSGISKIVTGQVRFVSGRTGIHDLVTYLESVEFGNQRLDQLLGKLLDPLTGDVISIAIQGTWAPSTAYTVGDIVTNNGIAYQANATHVSAATFDQANWDFLLNIKTLGQVAINQHTGNGVQTQFPLPASPPSQGALMVFVNGSLIDRNTYGYNPTNLTFGTAPANGAKIEFRVFNKLPIGEPPDNSITNQKLANGAVTNDKVAPNTLTADRMAPGVLDTIPKFIGFRTDGANLLMDTVDQVGPLSDYRDWTITLPLVNFQIDANQNLDIVY